MASLVTAEDDVVILKAGWVFKQSEYTLTYRKMSVCAIFLHVIYAYTMFLV